MVVELMRPVGDREGVAGGLVLIGEALVGLDPPAEAAVGWQRALDIRRAVKDRRADGPAARLAALK